MKKVFLLSFTFLMMFFTSCKKEEVIAPIIEKPKLLQNENTTSNGNVKTQTTYEYDTQQRRIKEVYSNSQFSSICEWTYNSNKMFLKCPAEAVDWDYTIVNGLVIQRLNKITNVRREYEYDVQKHLVKTIQYDANGKVEKTTNLIYNNESNKSEMISSDGYYTKYEYSTTVLGTTNITFGLTVLGVENKNAIIRETRKDTKGTILSDFSYAYETDMKGLITKKITTDVLNPNQQSSITVYTYQ